MTYPDTFMVIAGVLAPWLVQVVKTSVKAEVLRFVVSILLCAACGVIGAALAGKFSTGGLVSWITWTFLFAQLSFKLWWKPLFNAFPGTEK